LSRRKAAAIRLRELTQSGAFDLRSSLPLGEEACICKQRAEWFTGCTRPSG
jgi:hypothetical protein